MNEAVELSIQNVREQKGGPFGAVIVLDGKVIGRGVNRVVMNKDPTAHAEIVALRDACEKIGKFHLPNAIIYTSCEPCPMCYAALRWAKIKTIYYSNTRKDAAHIGFSDEDIYKEIETKQTFSTCQKHDHSMKAFKLWTEMEKVEY